VKTNLLMDHLEVEGLEVEDMCVESLVQMRVTASMKDNALFAK